jgi:sulfotransferase
MEADITFLSGLPRTGSTLLTSILSQNQNIHTQGVSALCQIMWDTQVSFWNMENVIDNPEVATRVLQSIPNAFYNYTNKHIIDKGRSWTLPANLDLIDKYITKSPKIIVMLRPIVEIVKSFVYIRTLNNWQDPEWRLLEEESEPIMRSLDGVKYARSINTGQFLFIWYEELVDNPQETINKIYNFCQWDRYEHNFDNITNLSPERDDLLNMIGLHDIRSRLSRRNIDVRLSEELYKRAIELDVELKNNLNS